MDLIHNPSKLDFEAHQPHSSSSSSSSQEEKEKRNWIELAPDVMSLIFLKLGTNDILGSAQWVCTSWWKLSKQPHLFRSIHVQEILTLFGRSVPPYSTRSLLHKMSKEAIDRSRGQLVEFSIRAIATDGLLHLMSEKSRSLRCIRLVSCYSVSDNGLIEMAKKLPQLEELEFIYGSFFFENVVFETLGCFCPRLKSCRLNYLYDSPIIGCDLDRVALAIANNLSELRHLNLLGNNFLTDEGLKAVVDGCLHLESLDLRQCFGLKFAGDLKERCRNIKVLRLPNDPTDDFEYEI